MLAKYVHGDSAWHSHQGQRVVEYQQALQTVSDPLLGWTTVGEHQYYVRQFRNMKGTIPLDAIDPAALADYAGIVGHLLAKGHARTSGASMIAGYAGRSDKLDRVMSQFARAYANQTEADHAELVRAVRQVASGKQYVHPTLGAALLGPEAPHARLGGPGGDLSDRELEVLRMMALGLTNAEIGQRLYVSVRTVETHRSHIHQKLNVRNRAELVRHAKQAGLLDADEASP